MNSVPAALVIPVVVFAALMTIGRWLVVNETSTDRLINRTWSWTVVAVSAYAIVPALDHPYFARCLYLGLAMIALASFYGLARLLDGADSAGAPARQRRYDATAVAVAVCLICGAPVAHRVFRIDYTEIVWTLSAIPASVAGFLFGRACVRELRVAGSSAREKFTYALLLMFSIHWSLSWSFMLGRSLAGTPPSEPGTVAAVVSVVMLSVVTVLTAIPLCTVLAARAAWDRTGRRCRRLRPLWRELTTAVPEVVLLGDPSAPRDPASQLYRMTVEIWDAILHLKQYAPEGIGSPGATRDQVRAYALRVASAVRAKRDGSAPMPGFHVPDAGQDEKRDRAEDLAFLIRLAREWPKAVAMADRCADTQPVPYPR
ncbi:MAB_1171c family putative transporter [Nocardia beijingensis]|uniref:MAB_1171c family putative transporter n=1 Tax=Nocardia beijingensis TaxID=95162 RepID=UPI000834787E|nr:MAB_1171c family putative transporter [Nocardia beijingensis]